MGLPPMTERSCLECGADISHRHALTKYCSLRCTEAKNKEAKRAKSRKVKSDERNEA
jgi:predicted nucleic acid-binding Zn ribbon protein